MKLLVTGATGLTGSHLLPLLAEGHEVVALVRAVPREPPAGVRWIAADLSRSLDSSQLPKPIDAVVHLAQSHRYRDFPGGSRDVFAVNVASTAELLRYAVDAGASQFLLASTGGVYARQGRPLREDDRVDQRLPFYPASKYAAEVIAGAFADLLQVTIFRPFFIYGPGDEGKLIAGLAARMRAGEPITLTGKRGLRCNPIYVADAAAAFRATLGSGISGVVNLAGPETADLVEVLQTLAEILGLDADVRIEPGPEPSLIADITRLRDELRAAPTTNLRAGLAAVAHTA